MWKFHSAAATMVSGGPSRLREIAGEVDSLNNSYYESLGKPSNQSALFSRGWNSIPKWHPITMIRNPEFPRPGRLGFRFPGASQCFPLLVCTSHDGIVRGTFIVPFVNVVDSYNPSDGSSKSQGSSTPTGKHTKSY